MYTDIIKKVHIEVTDKCNSECPVCPRNFQGGAIHPNIKNIQLGVDYFKLLGEDFLKNIVQWHFCGTRGEPMANTEIVDIVSYLRDITPHVKIIIRTNGGIGGVKRYKDLSKLIGKNGMLVFSVDGWEDTNEIYRKNVRWDKVKAHMDAYLSGPGNCGWDYLVFKHNYDQIPFAIEFAEKNNIQLEFKEPFGFDRKFYSPSDKRKIVYTLPVYDRKSGELLYEIEPETEREFPRKKRAAQPAGMYNQYVGAEVKRIKHAKNQKGIEKIANTWAGPSIDYYAYLKNYDNSEFYISCEALNRVDDLSGLPTQEIFIDCDGMFYPCCYLAGKHFMGEPQITAMINKVDKSKLIPSVDNSPESILKSTFFSKIMVDGLNGNLDDSAGTCHTCVSMCGKMPVKN